MKTQKIIYGSTLALMFSLTALQAQNVQPLYSFPQSPVTPYAALVQGPDGNLYGTTWSGGSNYEGSVFKVTTNGVMTTLYSFSPVAENASNVETNSDGTQPESNLVLGPNGNFYGTAWKGGSNGNGAVFEITTNGAFTNLYSFSALTTDGYNGSRTNSDGVNPEAGLTLGPDGNFYGTASAGGTNGNGTVFRVTPSGVLTTIHSFSAGTYDSVNGTYTNGDGEEPIAGLTLGTDGNLYGATSFGGAFDSGTLFKITTSGALSVVHTFSILNYNSGSTGLPDTNSDGARPSGALVQASDGNFYGTTVDGGKTGSGTIFQLTPGGVLNTLYTFSAGHLVIIGSEDLYTNTEGAEPYAGLTVGLNGNLYGTASRGGTRGSGSLFEITTGGTFTQLLTFTNANGSNPGGALILASNGNLYGTTGEGGLSGFGTVFTVAPSGAFTTIFSFADWFGANPYAGLTLGPSGNFYGTTETGGTNGWGSIFEIGTNGAFATLFSFSSNNGANPEGTLTLGPNGNFYGTASKGGSNGVGTVFEFTTNGVFTTLVNFAQTSGVEPEGALILGTNGNFYGTTASGGADESGTVFEVTTNGTLTTLYTFTGGNDGQSPFTGLALGTNGNLYGTCAYGGADYYGTVFEITNNGGFAILHTFTDGTDGAYPQTGLTLGSNGNFYGTSGGDGDTTYGTVFEMTPNGALTTLHTFTGGSDSGSPEALILGPDGNFYGTTYGGTSAGDAGSIFEVTSNGTFTTLVDLATTNGANVRGNLALGPDGNFYGTTEWGGADGIGEIYRLNLPPEITQQPASQTPATGGPVTLSVSIFEFGSAPYSIQWLSNGVPIFGATNSTFTIPDFGAGDVANYSVIVSNASGSTASGVADLTVVSGTLISGITVSASRTVTLNCQTLANISSRLWATTNLTVQADWTPISTNSIGGVWQFADTNKVYQQRYYRVSTP